MTKEYMVEEETVCPACAEAEAAEDFEEGCPVCPDKHTVRSDEDRKALLFRLKRIEGQVRGVEKMWDENAYCPEIMVQISAINSALNSFNKELLASHMKSCVVEDIQAGKGDEAIDELAALLQKVMK